MSSVSGFNEFKPRLKSPKNRFQLCDGLNLEKFNWNQPYLSPGLNLSRGSNSLNSASDRTNNPSLKYLRFTLLGCKDTGIGKFEFDAKTQFLCRK